MNKALAILHKYPQADPIDDFRVRDDGTGTPVIEFWNVKDGAGEIVPKPTDAEVEAWWQEYAEWRQATAYREERAKEYPSLGDQLDAIWKSWEPPAGSEAAVLKERIKAVKAKYPKSAQS